MSFTKKNVSQFFFMLPRNGILWGILFIYVAIKLLEKINKTSKKDTTDDDCEEITREESVENRTESTQPEVVVDKGLMKGFKLKPNFFIAFQVNNPEIHLKVKELQEKVIAKNPALFPALIKVPTLHVTLSVTHLASEKDIKTLKRKLDEWAEKNLKIFFEEPCILSFTGVKTFNNTVAYINLDKCLNYKKVSEISDSFNTLLSSAGFLIDKKIFKPHLTFLKLSKNFKLFKLKKKFKNDFESLKKCQDLFGKQEITSIQLLSMNDPKDDTGYYKCYHEIKVSEAQLDIDHSECCSPIVMPKALSIKEIKNIFQDLKEKK